jgi:ferredoxin-NADP reductase/nitrite reductase/ring-hydroxylating ferredoxin subunit
MSSARGAQRVANKKDLKEGTLLKVETSGKPLVLATVAGKIYAIDAVCTHEGGPLEEGKLEAHNLTCPWHYAVFDIRDGKVSDQTVWATDLQSYKVSIDDSTGDIFVDVSAKANNTEKESSDPDSSQQKYYEEEERKAGSKITLDLLTKDKLRETDIMTFRLSRGGIDFVAGQYAFFKLDGITGDKKGPIRHFSIASSPTEHDNLMISTRIRDTPYKQNLAAMREGDKILAWGPQGEFVLHDDYSKPAILLSGGIGVTPFRSMIKFATDKQLPLRITMFNSNKNEQGILYKDEFDKWAGQNKNVKIVNTLTEEEHQQRSASWTGEYGRISNEMMRKHLSNDEIANAIYYICGPPGMLKAMQKLLKEELKIPQERMKVESFIGY